MRDFGVNPTGFGYLLLCPVAGIIGHIALTGLIDLLGDVARAWAGVGKNTLPRLHWHATHGFLSAVVASFYGMKTVIALQAQPSAAMGQLATAMVLGLTPVVVLRSLFVGGEIRRYGFKGFLHRVYDGQATDPAQAKQSKTSE